jgi:hypothetical protein
MKTPNSRAACMVVTGKSAINGLPAAIPYEGLGQYLLKNQKLDAERKYRDYPKMTCCRAGGERGRGQAGQGDECNGEITTAIDIVSG